ncbi:putative pentatricopeptide repeat-containing protein At1g16830 [Oryza brachyantha]|nr:putative pentatricopeptide repeat-containing protein At1g16830 [Oryza brachyantha]XP_040384140.1 putative pentatricopeptide repeat-containing protein At1g16830 [Oryza brachyantha]XP_040384141.1 putative pentatricopeptide repeat-containing protein At1g16830 [Oryza brachyantha]XP_040384142.1 putative pentatricopeptide repeat-containing protein At1g16830 [Oryza brachyantha]
MLGATRTRTPRFSLSAATAFFTTRPHPPPLSPRLVDTTVSRCPSDALALNFFLWCARRPAYFHPPASFDRLLPAAARLASRLRTAPAILHELRALGCPIRPHTFLLLLRLYWRGGIYHLVLQLFDQMPLWGFHPNAFARNAVLDVLLRTRQHHSALCFLRDNPSPNYLTYAILLTHLCKAENWPGARGCFLAMLHQGFIPSSASLAAVFACCSKLGAMSHLLQLLSFILVSGYQFTSAMWACLIARLCREGRLDEAISMLAKMLGSGFSPTVVTYTPLVRALYQSGRHDIASELFTHMSSTNCSPDLVLHNVLMDCMAKERRYDAALGIYLNLRESQIKPDAYTLSTVVQVLQLSGNVSLLPRLLLDSDIPYDLVACNSVLNALCKSGFPSQAVQFFINMIKCDIKPDSYSYVGLLDSLCQLGRIDHAVNLYRSIVSIDPDSNAYIHAAILHGLVKKGQNRMALMILNEAIRQNCALDAVCYTVVLHGLLQAHMIEEACMLFNKMKYSGMSSNTCTYNVMLRGLCRTRDEHAVKWFLREMECSDVEMDSISFNTMIVLLIKLQHISSATALIREMINLGMELSTKTLSLISQYVGHVHVLKDAHIAENDQSDSTNDLLACSAS